MLFRNFQVAALLAALAIIGLGCSPEILPPSIPSPGSFKIGVEAPASFPTDFAISSVVVKATMDGYSPANITLNQLSDTATFDKKKLGAWKVTASAYVGSTVYLTGETNVNVTNELLTYPIRLNQTKVTPVESTLTGGTAALGDKLQLSSKTAGVSFYFTLDGSEPTKNASLSSDGMITLDKSGTIIIKVKAILEGMTDSDTLSLTFNVASVTQEIAKAPTIEQVTNSNIVSIAGEAGAQIYYTIDGTTPTAASKVYTGPIQVLPGSTTIKAIAKVNGKQDSAIATATVTYTEAKATVAAVSATASSQALTDLATIQDTDTITLASATTGATISYTLDGSNPTTSANLAYTAGFKLPAGNVTLKAFAHKDGMNDSPILTLNLQVKTPTPIGTATEPTISAPASSLLDTDLVSLSSDIGANIFYTIDGTAPATTAGGSTKLYSASFSLPVGTITVKAIATKTGQNNSTVASKTFTVAALPVGTVTTPAINLTATSIYDTDPLMLTSEAGATIYYTVDGTTPTTASPVYSAAFTLGVGSKTVKALAVKTGKNNSVVASFSFTVTTKVVTPVATSVTLAADKSSVDPSVTVTFTAKVLDQNGVEMTGQPVDLYQATTKQTGLTFSTATEGTYAFTAKSGTLVSNAVSVIVKKLVINPNAHYSTNPNGQVGKYKASGMNVTCVSTKSDGFTEWTSDMLIAQGAANDDAKSFYGGHEYPSYDSYSLYAAWDDTNLYLGWQFVYVNDIANPSNNGGNEAKPTNGDIPQMLVFDTDPAKASVGTMATGKNLWYDNQATAGFNFDLSMGVDKIAMFSSKGGVGQPSLFSVNPDNFFSYANGKLFNTAGIVYGAVDGLVPAVTQEWGVKKYPYVPDDLDGTTGWVDFVKEGHNTSYDQFYEMKIPFSALGITKADLETKGIGVMHVSIYGVSAVNSLPFNKSATLDNAMKPYSKDSSTSMEKEDLDLFNVPLARVGHL